jgi:hypothetical protein
VVGVVSHWWHCINEILLILLKLVQHTAMKSMAAMAALLLLLIGLDSANSQCSPVNTPYVSGCADGTREW